MRFPPVRSGSVVLFTAHSDARCSFIRIVCVGSHRRTTRLHIENPEPQNAIHSLSRHAYSEPTTFTHWQRPKDMLSNGTWSSCGRWLYCCRRCLFIIREPSLAPFHSLSRVSKHICMVFCLNVCASAAVCSAYSCCH